MDESLSHVGASSRWYDGELVAGLLSDQDARALGLRRRHSSCPLLDGADHPGVGGGGGGVDALHLGAATPGYAILVRGSRVEDRQRQRDATLLPGRGLSCGRPQPAPRCSSLTRSTRRDALVTQICHLALVVRRRTAMVDTAHEGLAIRRHRVDAGRAQPAGSGSNVGVPRRASRDAASRPESRPRLERRGGCMSLRCCSTGAAYDMLAEADPRADLGGKGLTSRHRRHLSARSDDSVPVRKQRADAGAAHARLGGAADRVGRRQSTASENRLRLGRSAPTRGRWRVPAATFGSSTAYGRGRRPGRSWPRRVPPPRPLRSRRWLQPSRPAGGIDPAPGGGRGEELLFFGRRCCSACPEATRPSNRSRPPRRGASRCPPPRAWRAWDAVASSINATLRGNVWNALRVGVGDVDDLAATESRTCDPCATSLKGGRAAGSARATGRREVVHRRGPALVRLLRSAASLPLLAAAAPPKGRLALISIPVEEGLATWC